ncbi:cell division protein ZapA [Parachitinimonas caeni]|uniref:Cell division protein ZapA n=1 Tax=Parachitinimonas caeni TaxID=3031301 RepID=A0ABT7DRE2_9NEIS|nr:cell division protein ZapA [Parachitinimonas caeni]MDK2122621.1 cell division protein ZapA [Parachitinimonas caeni]
MTEPKSIDVTIMGREFRVACPEDEEAVLLQAVSYLDQKMREIRDAGKVIGIDKIAIMAALDITHEMLNRTTPADFDMGDFRRRIARMQNTIEAALTEKGQIS